MKKKNFDLISARDFAGLTQAEAAKKMAVTRRTISRWETGAVAMPKRKWSLFLKLTDIKKSDLPKRLQYDKEGFPLGFDRKPFVNEDEEWDGEGEEDALAEIEGDEYDYRSRERYRIFFENIYRRDYPDEFEALTAQQMVEYDERERRYKQLRRLMGD